MTPEAPRYEYWGLMLKLDPRKVLVLRKCGKRWQLANVRLNADGDEMFTTSGYDYKYQKDARRNAVRIMKDLWNFDEVEEKRI